MLRFAAWHCLHDCVVDATAFGNIRQCYNVKGHRHTGLRQNCKAGEEHFPVVSFPCLRPRMSFNVFQTSQGPGALNCSRAVCIPRAVLKVFLLQGLHPFSNHSWSAQCTAPSSPLGLMLHDLIRLHSFQS